MTCANPLPLILVCLISLGFNVLQLGVGAWVLGQMLEARIERDRLRKGTPTMSIAVEAWAELERVFPELGKLGYFATLCTRGDHLVVVRPDLSPCFIFDRAHGPEKFDELVALLRRLEVMREGSGPKH